jgi:hydroxymethylbilane synthase
MNRIKLGSRKSKLALWQANHITDRLQKANPGLEVELVKFVTQGDRRTDVPLSQVGGKGLFVKEIEDALLTKQIDIAVHSLKDMPGILPPGLRLGCTPTREDPRDALIGKDGRKLKDLQPGAVVGTSSLRRVAQLKHVRPDLQVVALRGNVDTRLRRLENGDFDAIILAYAGLKRLGLNEHVTEILEQDLLLPAVGQGALAIETREGDAETLAVLAPLHDHDTHDCITAERAFLAQAEGSCQVPLAAYGQVKDDQLFLSALIASPAGNPVVKGAERGPRKEAAAIGKRLAERLLAQGGFEILDACRALNP